jgi:hypothetical protein
MPFVFRGFKDWPFTLTPVRLLPLTLDAVNVLLGPKNDAIRSVAFGPFKIVRLSLTVTKRPVLDGNAAENPATEPWIALERLRYCMAGNRLLAVLTDMPKAGLFNVRGPVMLIVDALRVDGMVLPPPPPPLKLDTVSEEMTAVPGIVKAEFVDRIKFPDTYTGERKSVEGMVVGMLAFRVLTLSVEILATP